MSKTRRAKTITGSGVSGKEIVMGVLRSGTKTEPSKVTAEHVPNRTKGTVQVKVREVAEPDSAINSNSLASYNDLKADHVHQCEESLRRVCP